MENNEIMMNEEMVEDTEVVETERSGNTGLGMLIGAGITAGLIFGGKAAKKGIGKIKTKIAEKKAAKAEAKESESEEK